MTGGGSGIGRAAAQRLAVEGAAVAVGERPGLQGGRRSAPASGPLRSER